MKLVMISDTHNKHNEVKLPRGDVLIHAGDVTNWGSSNNLDSFLEWFRGLDYEHKILISGNHDTMFQWDLSKEMTDGFVYLQDSSVEINGVKFYGSPWTPWYGDWAFTVKSEKERGEIWSKIPDDVDVLITHGPPLLIQDRSGYTLDHVGCAELLKRVNVVRPKVHVFGHIHFDYGTREIEGTTFVNASLVGENRLLANDPIVLDI